MALMTIVGLPENLIQIMVERARKAFPDARIAVLDFARSRANFSDSRACVGADETFGTISDFLGVLKSSRREPGPPQPVASGRGIN